MQENPALKPIDGHTYVLAKDVNKTRVFVAYTLKSDTVEIVRGRVGFDDKNTPEIRTFRPRGPKSAQEVAKDFLSSRVATNVSTGYTLADQSINLGAQRLDVELVPWDKFVNRDILTCFTEVPLGDLVKIILEDGQEPRCFNLEGGRPYKLPAKIAAHLEAYKGKKIECLSTLTWRSPNGDDHETKTAADLHGGSSPELIIFSTKGDTADDINGPLLKVNDWEDVPGLKVLTNKDWGMRRSTPDSGIFVMRTTYGLQVARNSKAIDYLVVAAVTKDYGKIAAIKFGDDGIVAKGALTITGSFRDTMKDLCVPSQATDKKNYTRKTPADFELESGLIWLNPKDYFTVKTDRGIVTGVALDRIPQTVLDDTSQRS